MTPGRARELWAQRSITNEIHPNRAEEDCINALWSRLPGDRSYMSAFFVLLNGETTFELAGSGGRWPNAPTMNYEGLTFVEWVAAACFSNPPPHLYTECEFVLAWAKGEDPTEYVASIRAGRKAEK